MKPLSKDLFIFISAFLNDQDIYRISLVNKRLNAKMKPLIWRHLYVCVSNYSRLLALIEKGRFQGAAVSKLTIFGEFDRSQMKELQVIWPLIKPIELCINSSVVDFPSFYKTAVFFEHIRVLKAYENCIDWIDFKMMPKLKEIHSVDHTNVDRHVHLNIPNVTKIVLMDFVSELNREYSDYVYNDSQGLSNLIDKMAFPYLKELHSYNGILGHDGIAIDFSHTSPLIYPNLEKMIIFEKKQTVNSYQFLKRFEHLKHYKYETDSVFSLFKTVPVDSKIQYLWIIADELEIDVNFREFKMTRLRLECNIMTTATEIDSIPKCDILEIRVGRIKILKIYGKWSLFDQQWFGITERDAFKQFSKLLS